MDMIQWFEFDHLPDHLQSVYRPFYDAACSVCDLLEPEPERTRVMLQLVVARDAAVIAKLNVVNDVAAEIKFTIERLQLDDRFWMPPVEECVSSIVTPDWDNARRVHDWRNHVPEFVKKQWECLTVETRVVTFWIASESASDEDWD